MLAVLLVAAAARPADAQEFFPRFEFRLDAEYLSNGDERFTWDADFGGDLDIVDYGIGRVRFVADYEVILGDQFRRFDANQGNYTLEGSASVRRGRFEYAGVFHHISRHLSDRPKRLPVDWNMMGVRVNARAGAGRFGLTGQADLRAVVAKSFVDYDWEFGGAMHARYALHSRVALISGAGVRVLGVDASRGRGTQVGGRGEAGVRVEGGAGAVEFFAAVERRIDPYPLEFWTDTWLTAGFRLRSR